MVRRNASLCFVAPGITSAFARSDLGLLGFPRCWPSAYYENQALRSLLGKKGSCRAGRVAVVGKAINEVREYAGQIEQASLLPWQGRINADRIHLAAKLEVVEGWAVFERLELQSGQSFVALRYAWNALPDGRWVDFSHCPERERKSAIRGDSNVIKRL
eukprot:symbB.v1.2.029907.t1/scaffold3322.1/size91521/5